MSSNALDRVEKHAKSLEAMADAMEKDGVGLHPSRGHVALARRMAAAMRADAANGKVPHERSAGSASRAPKSTAG